MTTEREFQSQVESALKLFGWRAYHTWRSDHSAKGFPDIFAVRPPRAIAVELKSDRRSAVPTAEQEAWIADLAASGVEARICWPYEVEEIARWLQ